jgi:signal transduction histidine kinase
MKNQFFFNVMLQTSSDGVIFLDTDGHVIEINQVCATFFNTEKKISDAKPFIWELVKHSVQKSAFKKFFEQIISQHPTPKPYYGELYVKENLILPICLNWNYVYDDKDTLQGIVCIIQDNTENVKEQNTTPTILEQVQYSRLATIEEVVARISHELNQPLSAIINYSGGSLRHLEKEYPNSDLMQSMKMILRQAERAGEVIARMKSFLQNGELRKESLNINKIIMNVIDCMRPELHAANIHVSLKLGNFIPAVYIDKIQIEQVLLNLIQNSLEAMRNQEKEKRLIIIETMIYEKDKIIITIQDFGHGVTLENADKIFNSFFTTKNTGMGIGLAISQSIVEAHGGKLTLAASTDEGATFHLILNSVNT